MLVQSHWFTCTLFHLFFKDPTEATGLGENATVAEGAVKLFTCSVGGNPEPGIEWYSENNGRIWSNGKQLEASKSGCYTCVASNNIGPPVNITHCLAIISKFNFLTVQV